MLMPFPFPRAHDATEVAFKSRFYLPQPPGPVLRICIQLISFRGGWEDEFEQFLEHGTQVVCFLFRAVYCGYLNRYVYVFI